MKTDYPIIIGGENFGCGSSREHAPVSLGASGDAVMHAACVAFGLLNAFETQCAVIDAHSLHMHCVQRRARPKISSYRDPELCSQGA